MEIIEFEERHIDDASARLAARYEAESQNNTLFPVRVSAAGARAIVAGTRASPGMSGVVAVDGSRIVGFLLGRLILSPPTSTAALVVARGAGVACHAAEPSAAYEAYRQLYAAVAPAWVASGCFTHGIQVSAFDQQAVDAWFSLGFGQAGMRVGRDTNFDDVAGTSKTIEIRQGTSQDVDEIARLVRDLYRHLAIAPNFAPYFSETEPALRAEIESLVADSKNTFWLALLGERVIGVISVGPPPPGVVLPLHCVGVHYTYVEPAQRCAGIGATLLARSMEWARDSGYHTRCSTI